MTRQTLHFIRYWLPSILFAIAIFIQSSMPSPKEIPQWPHIDKILHLHGYALLGLLIIRGFQNSRFRDDQMTTITASILLTALYGISDEIHQSFVISRTASVADAIFDFLGAIVGVFIYQLIVRKYPQLGSI